MAASISIAQAPELIARRLYNQLGKPENSRVPVWDPSDISIGALLAAIDGHG